MSINKLVIKHLSPNINVLVPGNLMYLHITIYLQFVEIICIQYKIVFTTIVISPSANAMHCHTLQYCLKITIRCVLYIDKLAIWLKLQHLNSGTSKVDCYYNLSWNYYFWNIFWRPPFYRCFASNNLDYYKQPSQIEQSMEDDIRFMKYTHFDDKQTSVTINKMFLIFWVEDSESRVDNGYTFFCS